MNKFKKKRIILITTTYQVWNICLILIHAIYYHRQAFRGMIDTKHLIAIVSITFLSKTNKEKHNYDSMEY